jgi:hypothetical protein
MSAKPARLNTVIALEKTEKATGNYNLPLVVESKRPEINHNEEEGQVDS